MKYCKKCKTLTKHLGNWCMKCFKKMVKEGKSASVTGNRTGGKWG